MEKNNYYLNKRCTVDESFLQFSLPHVSTTQLSVMFQLCLFPGDGTGGKPDSLICDAQFSLSNPARLPFERFGFLQTNPAARATHAKHQVTV